MSANLRKDACKRPMVRKFVSLLLLTGYLFAENSLPLPAPSYNTDQAQAQPVFDPETGEAIVEKQTGYKFVDGATVETQFALETEVRGTTLSAREIQSLALMNARQKHVEPGWGLLGLAGCGAGLMGGIMFGDISWPIYISEPGFFILGGALGLSLPPLFASAVVSVPYYPAEIKTQNGKQLYKDAYVKETGLLRRRATLTGTGVGLLGFGAFMLVLTGFLF